MKTSVILKSESRELLGTIIKQRTEDSFLCLTDLQNAYDKARIEFGWSDRDISNILSTQTLKERVYEILLELKLIEPRIDGFMENIKTKGLTTYYKELNIWNMKGRGENRQVWVNPYIFIAIALEMNPKLYAKTVIWLTDSLIFDRKEAGGLYLPMNIAINTKLNLDNYYTYAMAINQKVFGFHEKGIRNLADKKDLKKISILEEFITSSINMNFIKTESDILNTIQNYEFNKFIK